MVLPEDEHVFPSSLQRAEDVPLLLLQRVLHQRVVVRSRGHDGLHQLVDAEEHQGLPSYLINSRNGCVGSRHYRTQTSSILDIATRCCLTAVMLQ